MRDFVFRLFNYYLKAKRGFALLFMSSSLDNVYVNNDQDNNHCTRNPLATMCKS